MPNYKRIERGTSYIYQLIEKNKISMAVKESTATSSENSDYMPAVETADAILALSPIVLPQADKESDETVIARLAAMTELEYGRARQSAADKLGPRTTAWPINSIRALCDNL